jgi:hypothetical protein
MKPHLYCKGTRVEKTKWKPSRFVSDAMLSFVFDMAMKRLTGCEASERPVF